MWSNRAKRQAGRKLHQLEQLIPPLLRVAMATGLVVSRGKVQLPLPAYRTGLHRDLVAWLSLPELGHAWTVVKITSGVDLKKCRTP